MKIKKILINPTTLNWIYDSERIVNTINSLITAQEEIEKRTKKLEDLLLIDEPMPETIEKMEFCTCKNPLRCGGGACMECGKMIQFKENLQKLQKGNYWMINTRGLVVQAPKSGYKYKVRKAFGDCFKTRKQAELALKRVEEVFKRIK